MQKNALVERSKDVVAKITGFPKATSKNAKRVHRTQKMQTMCSFDAKRTLQERDMAYLACALGCKCLANIFFIYLLRQYVKVLLFLKRLWVPNVLR